LSVINGRNALEMIKKDFVSAIVGSETYWLSDSLRSIDKIKSFVLLLPAYDEFLISYKDRGASLNLDHQPKAFSINGIFYPTIVINGQVTGLWKRTIKKDTVIVETNYFKVPSASAKKQVEKAAKQYGKFLGCKATVNTIGR